MQRVAQVEALRNAHAETCAHAAAGGLRDASHGPFHSQPQTASALLVGDFNMRPTDSGHARLTVEFDDGITPAFDDAWAAVHPRVAQPPTTGVHDRVQWPEAFACDFVFATRDLRQPLAHRRGGRRDDRIGPSADAGRARRRQWFAALK